MLPWTSVTSTSKSKSFLRLFPELSQRGAGEGLLCDMIIQFCEGFDTCHNRPTYQGW